MIETLDLNRRDCEIGPFDLCSVGKSYSLDDKRHMAFDVLFRQEHHYSLSTLSHRTDAVHHTPTPIPINSDSNGPSGATRFANFVKKKPLRGRAKTQAPPTEVEIFLILILLV